jgi:hypothetical protein
MEGDTHNCLHRIVLRDVGGDQEHVGGVRGKSGLKGEKIHFEEESVPDDDPCPLKGLNWARLLFTLHFDSTYGGEVLLQYFNQILLLLLNLSCCFQS